MTTKRRVRMSSPADWWSLPPFDRGVPSAPCGPASRKSAPVRNSRNACDAPCSVFVDLGPPSANFLTAQSRVPLEKAGTRSSYAVRCRPEFPGSGFPVQNPADVHRPFRRFRNFLPRRPLLQVGAASRPADVWPTARPPTTSTSSEIGAARLSTGVMRGPPPAELREIHPSFPVLRSLPSVAESPFFSRLPRGIASRVHGECRCPPGGPYRFGPQEFFATVVI